jgi:GNAT superfamily N-acetyltransferase
LHKTLGLPKRPALEIGSRSPSTGQSRTAMKNGVWNLMKPICHPYQTEEDFWRMREFLREVFLLNDRLQRSWHVARLDYARWHSCLNCAGVHLEDVAFLWESDGQIIAFLMPDGGPGEAHLCVHPGLRTEELEAEMITVAEEHLATVQPNASRKLSIWAPAQDTLRQEILSWRGYTRDNYAEYQWRRWLDSPIPNGAVAPGYTIRRTRSAYFEPVATVPTHQRRGLGKALMTEGLQRLQRMGATTAFVGGYSTAANALYRSVMGPDHERYEPWVKEW